MINEAEIIGKKEKRIVLVASISHKKGPMLLIHCFHAIHKHDPEFTLHLIGDMVDPRFAVYFDTIIPELGLKDSIQYYGKVEHVLIPEFLANYSYILSTSPHEGMPLNILEGLQYGLTPLIHSWLGAKDLYPADYIWSSIPQLIEMVKLGPKNPKIFKKFVQENYPQKKQFDAIDELVENLLEDIPETIEIKKNSTVACVIAVKNGEKTIEGALESLVRQTKKLDQIVVINDASTDNTTKIISEFAAFHKDSTIDVKLITLPESKWVFSARNEGFKRVNTDYFFFLDHDDFVSDTYVEKCVNILDKNSTISIVYPDIVYFDDKGNEKIFNQPEFQAQLLAQSNFIAYCSMQRTKVFKELGGFSEYMNDCRNHLTEWELWFRYVKAGSGFVRLPQPLFHYFHDASSAQMSSGYERSRNNQSLELALSLSDDPTEIQMTGTNKRIVLVCQGKDYLARDKVGFELMQVYKPLEEFGDVYTFQYDVEMKHYGKSMMNERLIAFINLISPDYVFHFSYKADILPRTWIEITENYCTIVWHSDEWRYDEFCKDYEKAFRFAVTTYPSVYEKMQHPGKMLSQWAANTFYFNPSEKTIDVSFVGQANQNRKEFLDNLDIDCYGLGWSNSFIDFKEMVTILGKSKISISPSMGVKGRQLKLRPFEVTACNTLCICENMPGIENYFIPDKEIVLFDTKEELKEKIEYYLEHDKERIAIAQAGYNRTRNEHLWSHRLNKIFSEVDKNELG